MNMFEEIEKEKEDLPKLKNITTEMSHYEFNGYQSLLLWCF